LLDFYQSYNGHTFVDSKGKQFKAFVELAPFQRWIDPAKKIRVDGRMGTIDKGTIRNTKNSDPEYLAFLESLNAPPAELIPDEDIEQLLSKRDDQSTVTPLIQAIRDEKARNAARKLAKKQKRELKAKALSMDSKLVSPEVDPPSLAGTKSVDRKKSRNRKNNSQTKSEGRSNDPKNNNGHSSNPKDEISGKKSFVIRKKDGTVSTVGQK
jgi:hypothetical protein